MEIWNDIKGYVGSYQVSNLGRVKSLERKRWNRFQFIPVPEKILKPQEGEYLRVALSGKLFSVHRLVCDAFIEKIDGKIFVNHKNGNKYDNRVENLEWCTKSENSIHSFQIGLQVSIKGSNHANSKINEDIAKKIKYELKDLTQKEIAKIYGIDRSKVYQIRKGISWKHV